MKSVPPLYVAVIMCAPEVRVDVMNLGVKRRHAPLAVRVPRVQADEQATNKGLLTVAEILGRRTQIRISPEVWCKWRGRWRYKRLRARHVTISCANPEQAELVLEAISRFAESLGSKWLARSPNQ